MGKIEDLEAKINKAVHLIQTLKQDNRDLRQEVESLKSHSTFLNVENQKARQILAGYDQIRRKHEQVTQKVERALATLNGLRGGT